MDFANKITSFEEVLMIDPFKKKSHREARSIASSYSFETSIYPKSATNFEPSSAVKVPKVIFFPDKKVMRTMIRANLKFGKRDKLEEFLLRFGVLEEQNWHVD